MGLKWNKRAGRRPEILDYYFTFPVQTVRIFNLERQERLEEFITLHKELLRWWLGGYIPSDVKDLTNIIFAHPRKPRKWKTTWKELLEKCRCLVNHLPVFLLILAHSKA